MFSTNGPKTPLTYFMGCSVSTMGIRHRARTSHEGEETWSLQTGPLLQSQLSIVIRYGGDGEPCPFRTGETMK